MAAAETARLIASLELQDKNFTRGLKNVERGIGRVDKRLGAVSGFLNRNMARALDSLASRGVDALAGTIEAASDLNEEITKSDAVFGKSAAAVLQWSTTTSAALGISQSEALAASGAYGNMFKTIGLTDAQSADFSKTMVELAADMASFNNEDPSEMLDKLRSGLSGEAEPLRRYGVLLSEAAVKEEAYASGLAKKGDKLTEAQKVQARYNLILKQTAVQQGDVAKTGGNLAGQQRKLNAMLADASATIGTQLLPVVTELTGEFVDLLKDPATQKGLKSFAKDLGLGAKALVSALKTVDWKGFASALGTAAGFAKDIVTAFLGLPSWLQAAVITGWGLNKVTGGLIGDLASGLIKGVLGINAGIVNVNGPVAGGGAGAGAGAGGASKLMNAVRILGAVSIAGASLVALAEVFKGFQETVTESQKDLLEKVNQTSSQGFEETIANLQATNKTIANMNPLENVLAGLFGGSEIVKNFEMAAGRIGTELKKGTLTRSEMVTALDALKETRETNPVAELPKTDKAIRDLTAAIKGSREGTDRGRGPETKPVANQGGAPGAFRPITQAIDQQRGELGNIKNAMATFNSKADAQKAELGNIKNTTQTGLAQQKAALVAQTAVNVAGNVAAAFQSAGQVMAQGRTTGAVNVNASATRGVAPPIVSTLHSVIGAIWASGAANRPVIQSTNVVNNYTRTQRTGTTSGSRAAGTGGDI